MTLPVDGVPEGFVSHLCCVRTLESIETGFSFPEFATAEYEWKAWVNEYIAESNQVLTVQHHGVLAPCRVGL